MSRIVMDASVALAWLLEETRPGWVDPLLIEIERGATRAIVPSLFWLEVGNTLARDRGLTDERAMDGLLRLDGFGFETVEIGTPPVRLRGLQLAREKSLTMYDAIYLTIAESAIVPLMTLDSRLAQAAASMGLGRHGGLGRISESVARYGRDDVDRISLAAIGAALAELRKQYSSS